MTALGEFHHGDLVRFRDGNDIVEGRVHGFDRSLAIVRGANGGEWLVAHDAMLVIEPAPTP